MRFLMFAAGLLLISPTGAACVASPIIDTIHVGFAGYYRAGAWTPLAIELTDTAPSGTTFVFETETIDAGGTTVLRKSRPIEPTDIEGTRWLRTVFQAGRLGSDLTIRLRSSSGELLGQRRVQAGTKELPVALWDDVPLWVSAMELPEHDPERAKTWSPGLRIARSPAVLPTSALAYRAVDLLILPGDLDASDAAFAAIRGYVAGGGRVAISLGDRTAAFEASPLSDWIPIETDGTIQLREFQSIEDFADARRRLPAAARVRIAAIGEAPREIVVWERTDRPLVAQGPYGFGEVTLFAFDFEQPTFAKWPALPAFIERALRRDYDEDKSRQSTGGTTDLATQLLRAEDNFPGISRTSVGQVLLLLLVYAVIVGPLDYLLVHRLLKRPALTWLSLPLIVMGAVWLLNTYAVAMNGSQSQYRRVTFLDHDLASGTRRGRSIITLYAAEAVRADLGIRRNAFVAALSPDGGSAASEPRMAWAAPPETTFGGLYRETAGGLFQPSYTIAASPRGAQAKAIPLLVWSSRQFESGWLDLEEDLALTAELTSPSEGFLRGPIEHQFTEPVRDWMIVFGDQVYIPRDDQWRPGQRLTLNSDAFERRDLRSLLTAARQFTFDKNEGTPGENYRILETAYDQQGVDPALIARMLSFHQAAGGQSYTGLTNTFWSREDLTPLLDFGRAVLWGEIRPSAKSVEITSDPAVDFKLTSQRTFIRIILPVARTSAPQFEPLAVEEDD